MADARKRLTSAIKRFEEKNQNFTLPMLIREADSHQITAFRNSDIWQNHVLLEKSRDTSKHDSKQRAKIASALERLSKRGDYVTLASLKRESSCGPSVLLKHKDIWIKQYVEPNTVSHSPLKKEARTRIAKAVAKLEDSGEKITVATLCKLAKAGHRTVINNRDLWCHIEKQKELNHSSNQ